MSTTVRCAMFGCSAAGEARGSAERDMAAAGGIRVPHGGWDYTEGPDTRIGGYPRVRHFCPEHRAVADAYNAALMDYRLRRAAASAEWTAANPLPELPRGLKNDEP